MAWLLDTDICSYAIKNKPPQIAQRLFSKTPGEVMVSTITVYELVTGCEKSPARERLLKEVNAFLAPFSKLVFTAEDACKAAWVRAALEKKGTPIGPYDVLLAAQALARDLTLATNNTREFRRVKGLKLEDWST
ncbi:MAG: type II toxin-antitoxin system VapC family toxin [Planctomycetes bacterium]|nr:type II toxin-antitoxin system VapC family toxin [Planctomycetota bacterium]